MKLFGEYFGGLGAFVVGGDSTRVGSAGAVDSGGGGGSLTGDWGKEEVAAAGPFICLTGD